MTDKINAFIAEIRTSPKIIAGVAQDPTLSDHLDAIERGIEEVQRRDELIEIFDKIQAVIDRGDLSMHTRLIEIGKLLTEARDAGRSVN